MVYPLPELIPLQLLGKRTDFVILRNLSEQVDVFAAQKLDANRVSCNALHGVVDGKKQILVGQKPVVQV